MVKKKFPKKEKGVKMPSAPAKAEGGKNKTLNVKMETWNRLKKIGEFGETADMLISRLLDEKRA